MKKKRKKKQTSKKRDTSMMPPLPPPILTRASQPIIKGYMVKETHKDYLLRHIKDFQDHLDKLFDLELKIKTLHPVTKKILELPKLFQGDPTEELFNLGQEIDKIVQEALFKAKVEDLTK